MLTQDLLNEIFTYDPETGVLERRGPSKGGYKAAESSTQYRTVYINKKTHKVHRIIWLMLFGHIPKGMDIDHINGNRGDNRLSNLRLATRAENARNRNLDIRNTLGLKGVYPTARGFRSIVCKDGINIHLGYFDTPEDAAIAYDAAAISHFGKFARTNAMMGLLPNTSANV